MKLLTENDTMRVKDLSVRFGVSVVTIRRDLEYLEQQKYITKYHGSVKLLRPIDNQSKFDINLEHNRAEKSAIAKAAVTFIKPRFVISLDSSSTASLIVNYLPTDFSLKVITNCLITALRAAKCAGVEVIQTGGIIHPETSSTVDYLTTEFVKKFNSDIAFISSTTFSLPLGAFDSTISLIEVKKMYLAVAKKVIYMADSSKFDRQSLSLSIPLDKIDAIITDEKVPRETARRLAELGKELLIVDTKTEEVVERYNQSN
jgi:DeoR family transcriptional regulator, fructose operon transcriptional repressor